MSKIEPLYVSYPLLPELDDLIPAMQEIWNSRQVTNHGPLHNELEQKIKKELNVETLKLFNNGTSALISALRMLDFEPNSEVITTPFTFAATPHSIALNGLVPVFADIDKETLTINPEAVLNAITPRTKAILAVHVYGTICDVNSLEEIAKEHGLALIYDAAHAFGVELNGKGIANFGDASMFSFHATKLFNTIEGGAIATPHAKDAENIHLIRNFGIKNENEVQTIGLNGKMNEIQAAIGLLNLKSYKGEQIARSQIRERYDDFLNPLCGIKTQVIQRGVKKSEQYYPIRISSHEFGRNRNEIYEDLVAIGIYPRKYFSPICTEFKSYTNLPIVTATKNKCYANSLKDEVLCLPFHSGVTNAHIDLIKKVFLGK